MTEGDLHRSPRIPQAVGRLAEHFGERCGTGESLRRLHASQMTWLDQELPDAVVFPETTAEVQRIVAVCDEFQIPIIPFGAGTSMEGHVNAPYGGISVDMSRMNRIIAVNTGDLDCVVEPGVTRSQLNTHLRDQGLHFPIDPGADASLGGMASTRASGTNAVRYGTMRDNVISLKAVMPDGSVVRTARRARKTSAGYDLTRLMIGAEGTLGIITELTLRLHCIQEATVVVVCSLSSLRNACELSIASMQAGISIGRIELLDDVQMTLCNAYSKLPYPDATTLLVEFGGNVASIKSDLEAFLELATGYDCNVVELAHQAQVQNQIWKARYDVAWAVKSRWPGASLVVTDVCVPISTLAECLMETRADLASSNLIGPISGHVGDGNFHVGIVFDARDHSANERAHGFISRLASRAIKYDGTCTGEHGVGQGKASYLPEELGEALRWMRCVKHAIDPKNIMNPGKIFPEFPQCKDRPWQAYQ